jgi:hypothetical protein
MGGTMVPGRSFGPIESVDAKTSRNAMRRFNRDSTNVTAPPKVPSFVQKSAKREWVVGQCEQRL